MTSNSQEKNTLSSPIYFFKIISGTCLGLEKLKIPPKFTRKYGALPNAVFLTPPDGTVWKVYCTEHDGDIYLEKGWKEFVTYYSLAYGHLVMFKYQEASHLDVHIFDMSALEIEYPFLYTNQDEPFGVLNELHPPENTRMESPIPCPQPYKKLRTDPSGDAERSSELQSMPQNIQINGVERDNTTERRVEDLVSKSKSTAVFEKEATFTSESPSFKVQLRSSYVKGRSLNIPSKFAKQYLREKQMDVQLQVLGGRSWTVGYSLGKFYAGWKKFTSDNHLNVGDICHFELTNSQGLCLNVRFFHHSKETYTPLSQVVGDGANSIYLPGIIPDVNHKTATIRKAEKATEKTSLSIIPSPFTNGAEQEASKFSSNNPFFRVVIKPDHRQDYRPCVPMRFMRNYFNNKQFVMLQNGDKAWQVNFLRYPQVPTKLSKGWTRFSKENKLLVGDVCVFELINSNDTVLYVHIFRGQS